MGLRIGLSILMDWHGKYRIGFGPANPNWCFDWLWIGSGLADWTELACIGNPPAGHANPCQSGPIRQSKANPKYGRICETTRLARIGRLDFQKRGVLYPNDCPIWIGMDWQGLANWLSIGFSVEDWSIIGPGLA